MHIFLQIVNGLGGIFPTLIVGLLVVALPLILGQFVLGPISRAAGRLKAPTRFMLSDILWLLVHFQIVLWYCVQYVGTQHLFFFLTALAALTLTILATWCGAVSFASRAGVTQARRRITFILLHLPATLFLMILAPFTVVVVYLLKTGFVSAEFRTQLEYMVSLVDISRSQLVVMLAAVPLGALGLRRMANWVLSAHPQPVVSVPMSPFPSN